MYEKYEPDLETEKLKIEVDVRRASLGDVVGISKLLGSWEGKTNDTYYKKTTDEIKQIGKYRNLFTFVAHKNEYVLGFSKIYLFDPSEHDEIYNAPPGWYLTGITVDVNYRRKGIAEELTRARLKFLPNETRHLYYFTDKENLVSINFHKEMGFKYLKDDFSFPGVDLEQSNPMSLFRLVLNR